MKLFPHMAKSQDKKVTKRDFHIKCKTFFIIFEGLSVARNCLRPETGPLNILANLSQYLGKPLKQCNLIPAST